MKKKFVLIILFVLIFILFLLIPIAIIHYNLKIKEFYKPLFQNVDRKVFEETKSYCHGKIQDLGKYYYEYIKGDKKEKDVFRNIIILRFAEFDANKIINNKLKQFLIEMRGY